MPIIVKELNIPFATKGKSSEKKVENYFRENYNIILHRTPDIEGIGRPDYKINDNQYIELKCGEDSIRKPQLYWMIKKIHKEIIILFVNLYRKEKPRLPEKASETIYDVDIGFYNKAEVRPIIEAIYQISEEYFKRQNDIDYDELKYRVTTLKKCSNLFFDEVMTILIKRGFVYLSPITKKVEIK